MSLILWGLFTNVFVALVAYLHGEERGELQERRRTMARDEPRLPRWVLRSVREELGLSLRRASEMSGVPIVHISDLELDRRNSAEEIERLFGTYFEQKLNNRGELPR